MDLSSSAVKHLHEICSRMNFDLVGLKVRQSTLYIWAFCGLVPASLIVTIAFQYPYTFGVSLQAYSARHLQSCRCLQHRPPRVYLFLTAAAACSGRMLPRRSTTSACAGSARRCPAPLPSELSAVHGKREEKEPRRTDGSSLVARVTRLSCDARNDALYVLNFDDERLRQVELAVMVFKEELEDRSGLSKQTIADQAKFPV